MDAEMFEPLWPRRAKTSRGETAVGSEAAPDPAHNAAATERAKTILWVRGQIAEAASLVGTPGERYLVEHRSLKGPVWPPSVRWAEQYRPWPDASPRRCLLATVTNSAGEIVALHSIEIDPATGGKSLGDRPKMSRGPVSEGSVFLGLEGEASPTLVIGEGVETTMTRRRIGPCDAHACLGQVRFIEPRQHHRRVEILADTNSRGAALGAGVRKAGPSSLCGDRARHAGPQG